MHLNYIKKISLIYCYVVVTKNHKQGPCKRTVSYLRQRLLDVSLNDTDRLNCTPLFSAPLLIVQASGNTVINEG